ncbi:NADH-quinone oxidoreductase subunit L [Candidatus Binatia bacterium]|nr:NADH-quinone oxidoreductase subunit L [Candidatus Binatia bacterium]
MNLLRWIVLLPLAGAVVNGLCGASIQRRYGRRAISWLACAPVGAAFLLSMWVFAAMAGRPVGERYFVDHLWTWLEVGPLRADLAFAADPLTVVMLLIVTGVGGLIHIYSIGYMHDDRAYWRYFAFLNLFMFAMLTLVTAENVLLMFIGWEGVGLCSYALIGFWYEDWEKASAGSKAFIVNRIGDFGFLLGTLLLFWSMAEAGHPTLSFRELAAHIGVLEGRLFAGIGVATVITLLLFVGATGKSAQIPLYVWLPDAMAGPTPVSALIHAATMVTAGVYMIGRLSFLFDLAPLTLSVVAWTGTVTALFAASIALVQTDIKKVLAYSTVSQLGYMFMGMGAGAYTAGIFHLITHAFFKACLFLGAGSVIHAVGGEQDIEKMGGLRQRLPRTYWTFLISAIAIAGVFPFSGFFSKDEILWSHFGGERGSAAIWALGLIGAGLTAFYMFRLVFLTFHGESRADEGTRAHLHESPPIMTVPLAILAALAVVGGWVGVPGALGGAHLLGAWLAPVFAAPHGAVEHTVEHHTLELLLMAASVGVAVAGILFARALYLGGSDVPRRLAAIAGGVPYRVLRNKYWVDELYGAVFVSGTLLLARLCAAIDRHVIDGIVDGSARVTRLVSWINGLFDNYVVDGLVNRLADVTLAAGTRFRQLQTGSINAYLYVIVIGVVVVMVVRLL